MTVPKPQPAFTKISARILDEIIEAANRYGLNNPGDHIWVGSYEYDTTRVEYVSPALTLESDQEVRSLYARLVGDGLIEKSDIIEKTLIPMDSNIRLAKNYMYLNSFRCNVIDLEGIKQLRASIKSGPASEVSVRYDEKRGEVWLDGKVAKLRGVQQKLLMEILFKDKSSMEKEWQVGDIKDALDPHNPSVINREWPRATANNINNALAKVDQLGVKDLLIAGRQSVRVNPKYIGIKI